MTEPKPSTSGDVSNNGLVSSSTSKSKNNDDSSSDGSEFDLFDIALGEEDEEEFVPSWSTRGGKKEKKKKEVVEFLNWFPSPGEFQVPHVNWTDEQVVSQESKRTRTQYENREVWKRTIAVNHRQVYYPENPREVLIGNLTPNPYLFKSPNIPRLISADKIKHVFVNTPEALESLANKLATLEEIGLDFEGYGGLDTRHGFTALIQIHTTEHGCYLIDAIKLQKFIAKYLKGILEAEKPVKVLHGSSNDVSFAQRDFGIFMSSIMDTNVLYKIVNGNDGQDIKFERLVQAFYPHLAEDLKKTQTHSDWTKRPLSPEQVTYAIRDVYYLLAVYKKMKRTCLQHGVEGVGILRQAFEKSKDITLKTFNNTELKIEDINFESEAAKIMTRILEADARNTKAQEKKGFIVDSHSTLVGKHKGWTAKQRSTFQCLTEWRHRIALILDKKNEAVTSDRCLFFIAHRLPQTPAEVRSAIEYTSLAVEEEQNQLKIIVRLVQQGESYLKKMRTLECFNCFGTFHGPAIFCPWATIPGNRKKWLNRPENLHFKRRLGRNRLSNWERNKAREREERSKAQEQRSTARVFTGDQFKTRDHTTRNPQDKSHSTSKVYDSSDRRLDRNHDSNHVDRHSKPYRVFRNSQPATTSSRNRHYDSTSTRRGRGDYNFHVWQTEEEPQEYFGRFE